MLSCLSIYVVGAGNECKVFRILSRLYTIRYYAENIRKENGKLNCSCATERIDLCSVLGSNLDVEQPLISVQSNVIID
jgi:hypothetical protein